MKRVFCLIPALAVALLLLPVESQGKDKGKAKDQTDQIKKLEQQWGEAYLKADTATLDKIEADDFILHDPMGVAKTKAQEIQDVKSGTLKFAGFKFQETTVRVHGKTAIVMGVAQVKGTYMGQSMDGQ